MISNKRKSKIKDFYKNNVAVIVILSILTLIFIYSVTNVCIYIFGSERELYVELDNHFFLIDHSSYHYIWYNNGKKMVKETVHLSIIESVQWRNNSGYIKFKQLGTHLTHRSAFVYSTIYSIIFISFATWSIISITSKKKKDKLQKNKSQQQKNDEQLSLQVVEHL